MRACTQMVDVADGGVPVPLCLVAEGVSRQLAAALRDLIAVAEDRMPHLYQGRCPDRVEGPESRDPDCPACRALNRAQELVPTP